MVTEGIFQYVFMPGLLILVICHWLSLFWMTPVLWGIHSLYFFPRWVGWVLTLVTISFFIPPANKFWLKLFESFLGFLWRFFSKINKRRLYLAASLLSLPVFWLFRTKLFLLGDGYLKLSNVTAGVITATEPLDGILHHQFYLLLTYFSPGINPSYSYTIPSVLCGGVFIYLILRMSDLLGETAFEKVLIFISLLTIGSLELFFGYVESYTILLTVLTLFVLLSILYLKNRINIIFPFLALCFGIGIHVSSIVFIPALFYLMFWKWRREGKDFFTVFSVISILGCLVVIFLAFWYVFLSEGEGNSFEQFIPLFSSAATKFTLFSPAHLNEIVNQLLLVSLVGILLFLFFLFYVVKYKFLRNPIINYLLLSSLAGLFLIFVYNAHLGIADWDLRSLPGIFVTLAGILLFIKWGNQWSKFANYGLILIAVSFFHVIPWIALNTNTRMSVDRYVMTSINDPHLLSVRGGGIWRAARALVHAGFQERAIDIFKYGIEKDPTEIANYSYIAIYLSSQKRWDEAIVYLQKALKMEPQSKMVRSHLVDLFLLKGETDKALFYLDNIKLDQPSDSTLVVNLARPLLRAERFGETKQILQDYLNKNPGTAAIHGLMGMVLFFEKDESSAQKEWEKALRLNPNESVSLKGIKKLKKIKEK